MSSTMNASWDAYGTIANPGPHDPMSDERVRRSIRFLPVWKLELTENGKNAGTR